jgi:hypothetical protein
MPVTAKAEDYACYILPNDVTVNPFKAQHEPVGYVPANLSTMKYSELPWEIHIQFVLFHTFLHTEEVVMIKITIFSHIYI